MESFALQIIGLAAGLIAAVASSVLIERVPAWLNIRTFAKQRRRSQRSDRSQAGEVVARAQDTPDVFRRTRVALLITAAVIGTLFSWLQFKDISIAITNINPAALRHTAVIVLFVSWMFGVSFDANTLGSILDRRRNAKLGLLFSLFSTATIIVALWFAAEDDLRLAVTYGAFSLFQLISILYTRRLTRPVFIRLRTEAISNGNYFDVERFDLAQTYLSGSWTMYRLIYLTILVIVTILVAFSSGVRGIIGDIIASIISTPVAPPSVLVPSIFFLLVVIVSETWIWIQRTVLLISLNYLESQNSKYALSQRS